MSLFFFFFQAEDGIRDTSVTGVQTCALPISTGLLGAAARILGEPLDLSRTTRRRRPLPVRLSHQHHSSAARNRSEERRVGKECRSGWWPNHLRKKKKNKSGNRT